MQVGPNPIQAITRLAQLTKPAGNQSHGRSRPGHLLHLYTAGSYTLVSDGRRYQIKSGDIVYYHDCEFVQWQGGASAVSWIAVGFLAPAIEPPGLAARRLSSTAPVRTLFHELIAVGQLESGVQRDCRLYALVAQLLAALPVELARRGGRDAQAQEWWELEQVLRKEGRYRCSLEQLSALLGASISSVTRACRRATGHAPQQRLRLIRMDVALSMLTQGGLPVGQVADQLGYGRSQEFSREFKSFFGYPPSAAGSEEWQIG